MTERFALICFISLCMTVHILCCLFVFVNVLCVHVFDCECPESCLSATSACYVNKVRTNDERALYSGQIWWIMGTLWLNQGRQSVW